MTIFMTFPHGNCHHPPVNFKIHSTPKSETLESDYKQRFYEIKGFYEGMQFGSVLYRRI